MIKLKVGQDKDGANAKLHGAGGNNVESPSGDESQDQERLAGASSDKDSNVSTAAGNPRGREPKKDPDALKGNKDRHERDKDRHGGMSLDEEAKERLTSEGGPPPGTGARRDDLDAPIPDRGAPLRHRHGGSTGVRHHR
ncbi:MAG TPA: hypothetical protein VGH91_13680 [Gammaproteobacteria bacterium]|jgi:hypothetical protein